MTKPSARVALAGVFLVIILTGCAIGGSGSGTNEGVGIGGPAIANIGGTIYSGIPPEAYQEVVAELGVTKAAVKTFLKQMGEGNVPPEEYDQKLRETAKRYKELQVQLQQHNTDDDRHVIALKREAGEALRALDFNRAEALLNKVSLIDIETAKRLQEGANRRLLSAAETEDQLGNLKMIQFAYREAADHFRKAIEWLPEEAKWNRAIYLNDLGNAETRTDNFIEAESSFVESLKIRQEIFSWDSPEIARALNNLASNYLSQKLYAKAEPLYVEVLRMREKIFGEQDPRVARVLHNLATLYSDQGRAADAELLYKRALGIEEKQFGQNHFIIAQTLNNLANLYSDQRSYTKAEPLYMRAKAILEKSPGRGDLVLSTILVNLACDYRRQSRSTEVEKLYKRALKIEQILLGEKHPRAVRTIKALASFYLEQNRCADAEGLLEQVRGIKLPLLAEEEHCFASSTTCASNTRESPP